MRTRNNSIKLLGALALAVTLFVAAWDARRVSALNPQPLPPGEFGMVGLVAGQTARLNVVNIPNGPCRGCAVSSGSAVQVTLTFFDASGNQFMDANGQPVQSTITLGPGQSTFLDLSADTIPQGPPNFPVGPPITPGAAGGRAQIRAEVTGFFPQGPPSKDQSRTNPIISTLELFDNSTGKTTVFVPQGPPIIPVGSPDKD